MSSHLSEPRPSLLPGGPISPPRDRPAVKRSKMDESRIKVVVRKRPLTRKEQASSAGGILQVHPGTVPACLTLHEPKLKVDMTAYTEQHKVSLPSAAPPATSTL